MKNLRKYFSFYDKLDVEIKCVGKGRDSCGSDAFQDSLNLILTSGHCVYSYSFYDNVLKCLCDVAERFGRPICITSVLYDDITDSVVICSKEGDILSLQLDDGSVVAVNHLISVCGGIDDVQWSPDKENVLVSSNKSVHLLSATYYGILTTIDPCCSTLARNTLVNVGWGKKETQFHGSEGKAAAVNSSKASIDRSLIEDDGKTRISWRGDSQIFSLSYWDPAFDLRFIKIFDKSGTFLAVNENIPGLTGPISWRPIGDLLAFSEQTPHHCVIGFLEKNGLKHGEFSLPPELKVKEVYWNSDSAVLGLVCLQTNSNHECLLLWTTSNYHWYFKQKIVFSSPLVFLLWDETRANRFYGFCLDGSVFASEWIFSVDYSRDWSPAGDSAYVSVIDNDAILVTCFKESIVPPPMSRWSLKCSGSVNSVIFPAWNARKSDDDHMICTILHNNQFIFWKREAASFNIFRTASLLGDDCGEIFPHSLNQWVWFKPESLASLQTSSGLKSNFTHYSILSDTLHLKFNMVIDFCCVSLNYFNDVFLIQSNRGAIYKITVCELNLTELLTLPEPCYQIEMNSYGIYSLSGKQRLYKDGNQIASQITSFLLHGPYLFATTSLHTLTIFKNSLGNCIEISSRKLENGSKLVVASDPNIIFQLPRGNLELIQPRALTVEKVGQLLDSKSFEKALSLMCRQRIDLNLVVDHNPKHFLESVDEFVSQVDAKWLTLLITELQPCTVTSGLYAKYYQQDHLSLESDTKVKQVCEALYNSLVKETERNILPILGVLVKMGLMAEALELAISEDSLEHLLFLVDVEKLYTEALLAYNLQAALRIAGKSRQDPKEYLPYLNSLRRMESNYMKYTIDKSFCRTESALKHISLCDGIDNFNESLQLIKDHSLYTSALDLYLDDTEKYKIVAELYGDHLMSLKKYEEAGIMYKRSGAIRKAVQPYLQIGDWRQCIMLANQCGYSDKEKESLIEKMKGVLKGLQQYEEAASFCLQVIKDGSLSVEMLVQGKLWKEAVYIANSYGVHSLIETVVKKGLSENTDSLCEEIQTRHENLSKYCKRLQTVRESKGDTCLATTLGEPCESPCETSSVSSLRTDQSSVSRSSKNTRKTLKKMWSLKEGNPREQQALLATLTSLIESIEKMSSEVRSTCTSLLEMGFDSMAKQLHTSYASLLELSISSRQVIWPKTPGLDENTYADERLKIPLESCLLAEWQLDILKTKVQ